MTGWGQDGPLAQAAGHDLNYIALTGALAAIGRNGQVPAVPLNLIGDFGGGALYLAMGVLAASIEAGRSGRGQVVDAAIVDGTASLMTMFHSFLQMGAWATSVASISSTAAHRFTMSMRRATESSFRSRRSKQNSTVNWSSGWVSPRRATQAARSETLAGAARALRRDLQVPDPR